VPSTAAGAREGARAAGRAGDAEVEHPRAAHLTVGEEDVRRLDVPVDDPPRVGRAQGLADAPRHRHALGHGEPPALKAVVEVLPREPLHREPRAPVEGAVGDVPDDRRVAELGQHLRLAGEALRVEAVHLAEHLEGHVPPRS